MHVICLIERNNSGATIVKLVMDMKIMASFRCDASSANLLKFLAYYQNYRTSNVKDNNLSTLRRMDDDLIWMCLIFNVF